MPRFAATLERQWKKQPRSSALLWPLQDLLLDLLFGLFRSRVVNL